MPHLTDRDKGLCLVVFELAKEGMNEKEFRTWLDRVVTNGDKLYEM